MSSSGDGGRISRITLPGRPPGGGGTEREPRAADLSGSHSRQDESGVPSERGPLPDAPIVRNYMIVCLIAMVVLQVVLLHGGMGTGSLAPVLVGVLGVVTRWRTAPLLLLVALAVLYYVEMVRYYPIIHRPTLEPLELADVLLAGAVLLYTAGHYRLQGFLHEIVPREPRRTGRRRSPGPVGAGSDLPPTRSMLAVPPAELARFALLPAWAAAALAVWLLLPTKVPHLEGRIELHIQLWQVILLVWLVGIGLLALGGLIHYVGYRRHTESEARLFLQETVWRETRREQRRINRWLAWARLRRQRREEAS